MPINNTSSDNDASKPQASPVDGGSEEYPEQKHAGAVGYGPMYDRGASLEDKLLGIEEEIKGKVTRNPVLVEEGHKRRTGELKQEQMEETWIPLEHQVQVNAKLGRVLLEMGIRSSDREAVHHVGFGFCTLRRKNPQNSD